MTDGRRRVARALAVAGALALVGAGLWRAMGRPREFVFEANNVMSTDVVITVVASSEGKAREAAQAALGRMARVEELMSIYRPESELSRLNREGGERDVPLSGETMAALALGVGMGWRTGGAFDVTVGPLVALWRAKGKEGKLPTDAEVAEARARVGFAGIVLDPKAKTARFAEPGMRVDLGGIAKGYAVDKARAAIEAAGVKGFIVALAGDIYASGLRPDGGPWVVGVQDPRIGPEAAPKAVLRLRLTNKAVSTSGNYRRFSMINGRRISHILDPRTGQPAEAVASVTIIADDNATADGLATGVSVLGLEEGMKLVESLPGVEALIVAVEGGELRFHRSSGFGAYEIPEARP